MCNLDHGLCLHLFFLDKLNVLICCNLSHTHSQEWTIWESSLSFLPGCWRSVLRTAWRWDTGTWMWWRSFKCLLVTESSFLFFLQIFTEDLTEVETLPRDKVLNFLKEGFKELAIPYLEHIIYVWDDKGPEFHNVLIQLYLERVQGLMKQYLNSLPEGTERENLKRKVHSKRF